MIEAVLVLLFAPWVAGMLLYVLVLGARAIISAPDYFLND